MRSPHRRTPQVRDGRARIAAVLVLAGWPLLAWAHVEAGHADDQLNGLLAGLLHPVSGLDHVLAMVAVGLWGAQLGTPAIWMLPLTFPVVMALGGMLGLMGAPLPGVEAGIALSALVLGLAIVTAWRPALWMAAAVVGCFAIFHGHAHGTELPAGASGLVYSLGFVAATGALHAGGIGIGAVQRWSAGPMALRAAGAGVAAAGAAFLWRALT
jgi:urease accessory protein